MRIACAVASAGCAVAAGAVAPAWSYAPTGFGLDAGLDAGRVSTRGPEATVREHIPPVFQRDLPLLDRAVSLDDSQRDIARMLFEDIEASGGAHEALEEFRANLEAIMVDSQRPRLERFWHAVYRERMETAAAIAGEGVDLAALVRELMRGASDDRLDATVRRYRGELDPLLDQRLAAAADEARLLRVRLEIRGVNDRAIDAIGEALPPGLRSDFERQALERAYPTAFVPSAVLLELDRLIEELPLDSLRDLLHDAKLRYAAVCRGGMQALRARDDASAGPADSDARRMGVEAIERAERAYDEFDAWLAGEIERRAESSALAATTAGRAISTHIAAIRNGLTHRWEDGAATLARFDANGNGVIDGDEGDAVMKSFSRSVGRQRGHRL